MTAGPHRHRGRRKRAFFTLSTLLLYALSPVILYAQTTEQIRIGTYDNPPKIFRDERGAFHGFYADITREIMEAGGLDYRFVHGTWIEGLRRLQTGEIDVMMDVAWSDDREEIYAFNRETVFINWGVVYTRTDLAIESFPDLQGLTVAVMSDGIHTDGEEGVVELARRFEIDIDFLYTQDYEAAFSAVENDHADAAVVNRLFGLEHEEGRRIRRSTVVFNPISLRFAFNKESSLTPGLVEIFDETLQRLKDDRRSEYYRALERHVPGFVEQRIVIPGWLRILFSALGTALLVTLVVLGVLARENRRRRALQEEMARARNAAESANRAKSAFLANMSHEIRTPMNAILGYTQILGTDGTLTDVQRQYLERIESGGEHLLVIINEILDMSRIESGRTTLDSQRFDLIATIEHAATMIRVRTDAKGLLFTMEIEHSVPRIVVGDEGKVRQILVNLLGNAVKYTEEGGVLLRAGAENISGSDAQVTVMIDDTGIGIPSEDLERVFDPFEQVRSDDVVREGTGLGLPIARKLARLMGGEVTAQNLSTGGTRFLFSTTFHRGEEIETEARSVPDVPTRGRVVRVRPDAASVLIADDRESNRDILVRMLEPYGFSILQAVDGEEALEQFREHHPPLVLLDLVMPVMDGFAALEEMRRYETDHGLTRSTIMAVTASTLQEDRSYVLQAGADEFVRKPFRLTALLETIERYIPFEREDTESDPRDESNLGPRTHRRRREEMRGLAKELDPERRDSIRHALLIGDVGALRDHARELSSHVPDLAEALRSAVERFDFASLLEVLDDGNDTGS